MRSVTEHAAAVGALLSVTGTVELPLADCRGLVLAADLSAPSDLPPFANSAMDGYAVRTAEVMLAPVELTVSQDIPAGRTDVHPLAAGSVARIMTGAPLPDGADAVVPVEHTDGGVVRVRIDRPTELGRHLRGRGSDVVAGATVLTAGTMIGPPQIGLAAALGIDRLTVHRPLRVLILSTGDELVGPGQPLLPGQIHESNGPMLAAAVAAIGGSPTVAHFVSDDVQEFRTRFADATDDVDLVITSGGVSAGAYEVVKDALTGHGVDFVKVAMQPGMPQGAGTASVGGREVPILCLPGNPVSSFVSFEVFVRPAILAAMGHPESRRHRPARSLPLAESLTSIPGKQQYRRGLVDTGTGTVRPFGGPGSHLLGWLAGADSLLVVDQDVAALDAGDPVQVWDLTGGVLA